MSFTGSNIPFQYLMQPELLQEHEIRNILNDRCVRIDNIEYLNKEQLLNIFYRVITPLQQRPKSDQRNGVHKNLIQLNLKNGVLKPTEENAPKKIKLSPTKILLKRPNSERDIGEVPVVKKARQKITWP